MIDATWSWVLLVTFLVSLFSVSSLPRRAWITMTVHQTLWALYAYQSHQWGFLVMAVVNSLMYLAVFSKIKELGSKDKVFPLN